MTRLVPSRGLRIPGARGVALLAGAMGLSMAALAVAGPHRAEFPISVTEARDRAEAHFQALDADGNGEISPEELAAAPHARLFAFGDGHRHLHRGGHDSHGPAAAHGGKWLMKGGPDAETSQATFERLDENGDGLLSPDEFDAGKLREARHEIMRERVFARLDEDGSGGLSRDELPDMSRRLADMDADGDGLVTREEARQYREARREARRSGNG